MLSYRSILLTNRYNINPILKSITHPALNHDSNITLAHSKSFPSPPDVRLNKEDENQISQRKQQHLCRPTNQRQRPTNTLNADQNTHSIILNKLWTLFGNGKSCYSISHPIAPILPMTSKLTGGQTILVRQTWGEQFIEQYDPTEGVHSTQKQ